MHKSLRLEILSGLDPPTLAAATSAVNGSLPHLRALTTLNSREARVLPVFYHHLDPQNIPSNDEMDTEILATDTVDTITRALLDAHGSRILGSPSEDIIRARIVSIIATLDGISGKVASTPEIGILTAHVWSSYFREPHPASEMALRRLTIFLATGGEYGLDSFIEGAGSVDALAIMAVKLLDYLLNSKLRLEAMTMNLVGIMVFSMISVLLFAGRLLEIPTEVGLYPELFKQAWQNFLRVSALDSGYAYIVEAIDAGFLQLVVSISGRHIDWLESRMQASVQVIFQPATVYYPVLAALERTLPLIQQATSAPTFLSSVVYPYWEEFNGLVLDRLEVKRMFDSGGHIACRACDNLECTGHRESCPNIHLSEFPVPAYLTSHDRAFLRFLVAHDYAQHKLEIFLGRIRIHHHSECFLTLFNYNSGDVQIKIRSLSNGDSPYFERVTRSGRRMHPIIVQVTTGQGRDQQWRLTIRSSASEMHDALFQLSQGLPLPAGEDAVSDLSPAVHDAVVELIERVCPRIQEIVS
ncbi:hypothetical protein C8R45DRAFT_1133134 [Mycena sanguinolenta]|nr:hypothetical protein C8R45DRAFT_1133134 [Mycena sanguinolenta]